MTAPRAFFSSPDPAHDLEEFLTSFTEGFLSDAEDDAVVVDRHYAPGFVYHNDGHLMTREALIQHARPMRKNLVSYSFDVQEALRHDHRLAARYLLRTQMRKERRMQIHVCIFAELDAKGRLRRVDQTTRTLG